MSPSRVFFLLVTFLLAFPPLPAEVRADLPMHEGQLILEEVKILGNRKLTDEEVLEMTGWTIGQPFEEKDLVRGESRLNASGVFSDVEISTRTGSKPGSVVVVLWVHERRRPSVDWFEHEVTWDGWAFNLLEVHAQSRNRTGETHIKGRLFGRWRGVYEESSWQPVFALPLQVLATADVSRDWWVDWPLESRKGYSLEINRLRGGLGIRSRLPAGFSLTALALAERYDFTGKTRRFEGTGYKSGDEISRSGLPAHLAGENDATWFTAQIDLGADTRNDEDYPHRGIWFRLPMRISYDPQADRSTRSIEADLRGYLPLNRGSTLALRVRGGALEGDAPFYQRFTLSRSFPMRGFEFGYVEPAGGGKYLFQGSAELRQPLLSHSPHPSMMLIVFSDFGMAWNGDDGDAVPLENGDDTDNILHYDTLSASVGWGIAFDLPVVGPLAVHVGYPMVYEGSPAKVVTKVSLGFAF